MLRCPQNIAGLPADFGAGYQAKAKRYQTHRRDHAKGVPADSRGSLKSMAWMCDSLLDPAKNAIVAKLGEVAQELGCTTAQLAIAWCLKNPNVSTVITGASRVEQVTENMKALAVVAQLTPEVMGQIQAIFGEGHE